MKYYFEVRLVNDVRGVEKYFEVHLHFARTRNYFALKLLQYSLVNDVRIAEMVLRSTFAFCTYKKLIRSRITSKPIKYSLVHDVRIVEMVLEPRLLVELTHVL